MESCSSVERSSTISFVKGQAKQCSKLSKHYPLGPGLYMPYKPVHPLRHSWLPPLKFCDVPSEQFAFGAELQSAAPSSSQVNLLPSPFTTSPSTPTRLRPISKAHLRLKRSKTVATNTSSIYSQSSCAHMTQSRQSSTIISASLDSTSSGHTPDFSRPTTSRSIPYPESAPTICQPNHMLRGGGRPLRPGSTPAMPPSAFWLYARGVQQRCRPPSDAETDAEACTEPSPQPELSSRSTSRTKTRSKPRSLLTTTLPAEGIPKREVTSRHNFVARAAQPSHYERLRKGSGSEEARQVRPITWTGKVGMDRRLALNARDSVKELRRKRERGTVGRKLVKKRQP